MAESAESLSQDELNLVPDDLGQEPVSDDALFDAMLDAAAGKDKPIEDKAEAAPAEAAPDEDAPAAEDSAPAGEDQGVPDETKTRAVEEKPSDDQPPADDNSAPARETAPKEAPDAWLDTLTPAARTEVDSLRAQVERLQNQDRSHRGRQSVLQRRLDALQSAQISEDDRRLTRSENRSTSTQNVPTRPEGVPGQAGSDPQTALPDVTAALSKISEEYPELSTALTAALQPLQAELTSTRDTLAFLRTQQETAQANEQAALLSQWYPNYEQVGQEPGFTEWLQQQPDLIRDAAYRNAERVTSAEEAATVLDLWEVAKARAAQEPAPVEPQPAPASQEPPKNSAPSSRRERQQRSAASPQNRSPGAQQLRGEALSADELFDRFVDGR